jgi:phosphoglycolate phosphatase-like HAD superfamily hydrolase
MALYLGPPGQKREVDAIIFDLDGTLVWTDPVYRETVVKEIVDKLGKPFKPGYVHEVWFGQDKKAFFQHEFGMKVPGFWEAFNEFDWPERRAAHTNAYLDALLVPSMIKSAQVEMGMVTACPSTHVDAYGTKFRREYLNSLVIQSGLQDLPPKPDPSGIQKCCEELGVSTERAAYVGDEPRDAEAARNAGALDIIIDREGKNGHDASWVIRSLFELVR